MDSNQLSALFAIIIFVVVLPVIGTYKMFQKANIDGWKVLIPFLNTWYMLDVSKKPKWWFFCQFIPFLGFFFTLGIYIEFVRCFGKNKFYQQVLTVFVPFIYFVYVGFNSKDKYLNIEARQKIGKKPIWREWLDAGIFAIVAATLIRTFFVEAYTIPTGSMEGSLLVNDFLFVSKVAYGPRVPMTPIAVPLVHNTMPITGGKSYTEAVKWDYHRWWGFGDVKRYDVVVFNFPAGDTVALEVQDKIDYYSLVREAGGNRDMIKANYTVLSRPTDKKENYIKRCVGLPGDKIAIIDGILYVNDKPAKSFPHSKMGYVVQTSGMNLSQDFMDDNHIELMGGSVYNIANESVAAVRALPGVVSVTPAVYPKGFTNDWAYPQDTANFKWNRDNYGPMVIPKAGATVSITPQNIALYRRIIFNYEGNQLEEKGGKIFINGKEANTYTFKMDYYWMMGDNRHNSADSRYFGFVPIDHVVGKAWFVWLSYDENGIRWKRLLRGIPTLEK